MKLGISTYSFPWSIGFAGSIPVVPMKAMDLLQVAIENNIKHLQFCDNLPLHLLSTNESNELAESAKNAGVKIEVGTKRLTDRSNVDFFLQNLPKKK